jgi:RNA polymerase sigma-70 factor (ECF subfamily)
MPEQCTTASVQRYLVALAGDEDPDPIVRALLARAANRLHGLCTNMLRRQYTRLARAPYNVQDEEMLSLLVERLLKAMRQTKPTTVRAFFALANQHLRWELNEFARQIDRRPSVSPLTDDVPADTQSQVSAAASVRQMLEAIERLPDEMREIFSLVHIQGLSHAETADVLGLSTKTVQRRLHQAATALARELHGFAPGDLRGAGAGETPAPDGNPGP